MTHRLLVAALGALTLTAAGLAAVSQRDQDFPHEEHARLFPLCEGCHEGVPDGNRSDFYPEPATCAGCHDGTEQPRVDWQGPTEEPDNVDFEHPEHPDVDEQGGAIDCTTCHTPAGAPRMVVAERPVVPRCLACHEHRADDHYVDADCETCHIPLAVAPFDGARLASLPEPDDHHTEDFLLEMHGEYARADLTRCAVCHTRERCESCHVNAAVVETIRRMPAATGIVAQSLPPYDASYPVPPSHLRPDFYIEHGHDATTASCSSCHTREDCTSCHIAPRPDVVVDMPSRQDVRAPGVQVMRRAPPSHRAPMFEIDHGNEAGANGASCSACHARTMCTDCHGATLAGASAPDARAGLDITAAPLPVGRNVSLSHTAHDAPASVSRTGVLSRTGVQPAAPAAGVEPARTAVPSVTAGTARAENAAQSAAGRSGMPGAFHPANFLARHSAEAYGRRLECSNCHDRRLFCADCHESAGMSPGVSRGRLGPGFHDAEPLWLLRHGQAARQGLESCASCHAQNECMQCHSVLGAFKVSPHGPGFDARRAQQRNAAVCLVCHITDPLNGGLDE